MNREHTRKPAPEHRTDNLTERPRTIAPGKVTRTSKLDRDRSGAIQRKAALPDVQPRLAARKAWDHTMDPWMDMAHRGLSAVQQAGADQAPAAGEARPLPPGAGAPMPAAVQAKMERAFGADFSAVRIHQGPHAAALGARAYTQGADIHFAPGQYDPDSQRGQELLGHELAHVEQQRAGRVHGDTPLAAGATLAADPRLEAEADHLGARAARAEPAHVPGANGATRATGGAIQRSTDSAAMPGLGGNDDGGKRPGGSGGPPTKSGEQDEPLDKDALIKLMKWVVEFEKSLERLEEAAAWYNSRIPTAERSPEIAAMFTQSLGPAILKADDLHLPCAALAGTIVNAPQSATAATQKNFIASYEPFRQAMTAMLPIFEEAQAKLWPFAQQILLEEDEREKQERRREEQQAEAAKQERRHAAQQRAQQKQQALAQEKQQRAQRAKERVEKGPAPASASAAAPAPVDTRFEQEEKLFDGYQSLSAQYIETDTKLCELQGFPRNQNMKNAFKAQKDKYGALAAAVPGLETAASALQANFLELWHGEDPKDYWSSTSELASSIEKLLGNIQQLKKQLEKQQQVLAVHRRITAGLVAMGFTSGANTFSQLAVKFPIQFQAGQALCHVTVNKEDIEALASAATDAASCFALVFDKFHITIEAILFAKARKLTTKLPEENPHLYCTWHDGAITILGTSQKPHNHWSTWEKLLGKLDTTSLVAAVNTWLLATREQFITAWDKPLQ
jgi:hypothetical protein